MDPIEEYTLEELRDLARKNQVSTKGSSKPIIYTRLIRKLGQKPDGEDYNKYILIDNDYSPPEVIFITNNREEFLKNVREELGLKKVVNLNIPITIDNYALVGFNGNKYRSPSNLEDMRKDWKNGKVTNVELERYLAELDPGKVYFKGESIDKLKKIMTIILYGDKDDIEDAGLSDIEDVIFVYDLSKNKVDLATNDKEIINIVKASTDLVILPGSIDLTTY